MTHFKFASLAHPTKYGYAFDSDAYSPNSTVNPYFRQFETYGDGLIQHSGDWAITFDFLADFLASMAAAMLTDSELAERGGRSCRPYVTEDRIAFAASVKWKESDQDYIKQRYVSVQLSKVSSRKVAEYDKRYVEIAKWMDGSCSSILRLLFHDSYALGLERYLVREQIREWALAQPGRVSWGNDWPEYFDGDWNKNNDLRNAIEACRGIAEAKRLRENAEAFVEVHKRNLQEKFDREAAISAVPPAA